MQERNNTYKEQLNSYRLLEFKHATKEERLKMMVEQWFVQAVGGGELLKERLEEVNQFLSEEMSINIKEIEKKKKIAASSSGATGYLREIEQHLIPTSFEYGIQSDPMIEKHMVDRIIHQFKLKMEKIQKQAALQALTLIQNKKEFCSKEI